MTSLHTYVRLRPKKPWKKKPTRPETEQPRSVLHPKKRYPVTQAKWSQVCEAVFARSGEQCENYLPVGWHGNNRIMQRCPNRIFKSSFIPHHIVHRAHGGQDTVENIEAWCAKCHKREHGEPHWSKPA